VNCEILLEQFRGKEIRPGNSGETVNRGTVNQGFTVVISVGANFQLDRI
jgi:hypothetical protein